MNLTDSRNETVWAITDALCDARIAANSGHPCKCPYEHGTRLWFIWTREFHRTIQSIVDARAAAAEGRKSEAEDQLDAEDTQPKSFLARVSSWLAWACGAGET